MSTTPRPRLDAPVDPFRLNPADSGEPVGLDDLITSGPVVLVLVEGGRADDPRAAMLRELGERIASSPARPGAGVAGRLRPLPLAQRGAHRRMADRPQG